MEKKIQKQAVAKTEPKTSKPKLPKWDNIENLVSHFSKRERLEVPREIKAFCKEHDLTFRWINKASYVRNGGRHHNHWKALNIDDAKIELSDLNWGKQSDGFLYYGGDLILAVRPTSITKAHRKDIQQRSDRLQKAAGSYGSDELEQTLRAGGVNSRVFKGYEDSK